MKSNNRKVTYRYDAFGRRIISKKNGNKTAPICWGDSECAEYKHKNRQRVVQHDIMGHPTRLNSVIARDTARGKRKVKLQWYHKNYLDHVYAVSNDNGNPTATPPLVSQRSTVLQEQDVTPQLSQIP